jgi:hypothetical protein
MNAPTYSNSQAIPWDDLSNTDGRNWSEAASKNAEQLLPDIARFRGDPEFLPIAKSSDTLSPKAE